jgi:hypothetical protein
MPFSRRAAFAALDLICAIGLILIDEKEGVGKGVAEVRVGIFEARRKARRVDGW